MYIKPNYDTKRLFIRQQIKSIQGENLIDYTTIEPPIELIGFSVYIYFEDVNGSFILESLLEPDYQGGQLQYFIPLQITEFEKVKYKVKAQNTFTLQSRGSDFGFVYFKKDLIRGGEL